MIDQTLLIIIKSQHHTTGRTCLTFNISYVLFVNAEVYVVTVSVLDF